MFALFGPIMKKFPINWFSKPSQAIIKKYMKNFRNRLLAKERERLGINPVPYEEEEIGGPKVASYNKNTKTAVSLGSTTNTISGRRGYVKPDHRLHLPPSLLADEDCIIKLWSELQQSDREMCEDFTCLVSGRELQHVLTDAEITTMISEINRRDLEKVLVGEKGNGAKVMMEEMVVQEPSDFQHNKFTLNKLFENLKTDYYGRFNFRELQIVILEDRRVRLNAWAARILDIPIPKIKINKHVNPAAVEKERKDPRNLNYTLTRLQPLPLISKKPNISEIPLDFPASIIDKKKYMPNEETLVLNKLLHRNAFKFTSVAEEGKPESTTVFLMKNYNEGRHGKWNNYATLSGNAVPSYIKYKSRFDAK